MGKSGRSGMVLGNGLRVADAAYEMAKREVRQLEKVLASSEKIIEKTTDRTTPRATAVPVKAGK
jgi:hypothetical protein